MTTVTYLYRHILYVSPGLCSGPISSFAQEPGLALATEDRKGIGGGTAGGPLAAALLLLLTDKVGDRASDAAYQGPVLVKADAPVVVGIQVLDKLVSSLPVPRVLGENQGSAVLMWQLYSGPRQDPRPGLLLPSENGNRALTGPGLGTLKTEACVELRPWFGGTGL